MKNKFFIKNLVVLSVLVLISLGCLPENIDPKGEPVEGDRNVYIINYGNYGGTKSSIDIINLYSSEITYNAYKSANDIELNSNVQSAAILNGTMYLMSNNGDKIDILDSETLKVISNPISDNITKPRYFAAKDTNVAYVSCWGQVSDWTKLENSYIAKIDLKTKEVTKIPLTGGPEGMVIVNNKLFVALAAKNKIAVLDLNSESFSYINTPAIAQHFVKTINGRLFASIVSKTVTPYPKDSLGVIEIDPISYKIIDRISVPDISNNGELAYEINKLFLITKENGFGGKSKIFTIDTKTNELSNTALISGNSFTGIYADAVVNKIVILEAPSATVRGKILEYDLKGKFLTSKQTGIFPQQILSR